MENEKCNNDYRWTNERHLHFLKSVEASFVRRMLENDGRLLQMDRCLPDSCESTLDSNTTTSKKRRRKHFPSDNLDPSIRIDRRVKRLRLHPDSSSSQDDQVVPQIKHHKTENNCIIQLFF